MEMNALQKTILITGIALLSGGTGLMIYDRSSYPQRPAYQYHPSGEQERQAMVLMREAEEYLRQNTVDSSEKAMDRFNTILARDLHPHLNQMAKLGLGVAVEKMGDRRRALVHYRELKNQDILDPALRERVDYRLGTVLLKIGHHREGMSLLETTLARTRDRDLKSDIHASFGDHYRQHGRIREAKENYEVALDYDPDNLIVERRLHSLVGYRWSKMVGQEQDDSGYKPQEPKKEKEPVEEKQGKDSKQKDPKNEVKNEYDDGYLVGASRDEDDQSKKIEEIRRDTFQKAIDAYRGEDYDRAVTLFQKLTQSYEDSDITEKATYWLGETYEKIGGARYASQMYEKTLQNKNVLMDQPALIKKGVIQFQAGDLTSARESFSRAVKQFPEGRYNKKALEWKNETEAQLNEKRKLKSYSLDGVQSLMEYFRSEP